MREVWSRVSVRARGRGSLLHLLRLATEIILAFEDQSRRSDAPDVIDVVAANCIVETIRR